MPGATVPILAAAMILSTRHHERFRFNRGTFLIGSGETGMPGRFSSPGRFAWLGTGTGAPSSADNLGKFLPGESAECLLV